MSERFPTEVYELPEDAERLRAKWWRAGVAAQEWGCSRSTVYRLIEQHRSKLHVRLINVFVRGKWEIWEVIPAGTPRPEAPKGNPAFRDGAWQSRTARAREAERRRKAHPHT